MRELISGFLSNESPFGRLMTRCGIIIAANVMFIIFSIPVVTAGASFAALYHVMLKTLRGDGVVNPFVQFWKGFRSNFRQATIAFLAAAALFAVGYADVRICRQAGGVIGNFRYAVYALGVIWFIAMMYLFPVMAAFRNTLPALLKSSLYFAFRSPLKLLVNLFFHIFPMVLTYTDQQMLPLYAFLWCTFGFGAVAMLTARLLLPEFEPYLPLVDACGDFILDENGEPVMPGGEEALPDGGHGEKSEAEILEEMRRLEE